MKAVPAVGEAMCCQCAGRGARYTLRTDYGELVAGTE